MGEAEPGPRLSVVEDPAPRRDAEDRGQPPASGPTAAPGPRPGGRVRTLVLVALLICLGLLWLHQVRYAEQLEARVEALSSQLEEAREALGIYQQRVRQVRRNLDELASRVGALQELVSEDSLPASGSASAEPTGGDAAPSPGAADPAPPPDPLAP